jgi:hypothetical protein
MEIDGAKNVFVRSLGVLNQRLGLQKVAGLAIHDFQFLTVHISIVFKKWLFARFLAGTISS